MPALKPSDSDDFALSIEPGSAKRELGSLRGTITAEELEALLAPLPPEVIEAFYASAEDRELPPQSALGPITARPA